MKTCTLKQRLKLYKAALEEYRKYNWWNEFLCHLFENEFSVNFRLLKEVKELVPKKMLDSYVVFDENGHGWDSGKGVRELFLKKLIAYTDKKINGTYENKNAKAKA